MDFSKFKEKLSSIKSSTEKFYNETIDKGAKKLIESGFTIKSLFELEDFIGKSKYYFIEASGKDEGKKIICLFASKESDFFKNFLYELPLIYTKAWSRNIGIKLVESNFEGLDLARFQVSLLPSLVLFENEKVVKVVATEEKINKIVKSLTLDIEKSIKEVDIDKKEPISTSIETKTAETKIELIPIVNQIEEKKIDIPTSGIIETNVISDSDIISEAQNLSPKA